MNDKQMMQALAQPFDMDVIEFRVGSTYTKDGKTMGLALAYAESRAYMDRLDSVYGPMGWSTDVEFLDNKNAISTLSVMMPDGRTVTRKAAASDTDLMSAEARAFKRACAQLGIGRYLYAVSSPWAITKKRGKNDIFADDTVTKLRNGMAKWVQRTYGNGAAQSTNGNGNGEKPPVQSLDDVEAVDPDPQPEAPQEQPQTPTTPKLNADQQEAKDAIIATWKAPSDAQEWAVSYVDDVKDIGSARKAWSAMVQTTIGGSFTKDDLPKLYSEYYDLALAA